MVASGVIHETLPRVPDAAAGPPAAPAAGAPAELAGGAVRGTLARVLAVPLAWKLAGANALVLVGAGVAVLLGRGHPASHAVAILWGALAVSFVVNLVLVRVALQPIAALEETAARVWGGDFTARVAPSATADRDMARIAHILNQLLDGLTGDHRRMRLLASQIVRAQDEERSRIARELHDGVAQTLAAAKLQLQALGVDARAGGPAAPQLDALRDLVTAALEEVRSLSHAIYPRVLDDLGLVAALEWLARQARESSAVDVRVETDIVAEVPGTANAVLYRVAQEGLRNALRHARARAVLLRVEADESRAMLEVVDDGVGFDVAAAEARRPGMGLFAIRERVALVGGTVEFYSVVGRGTRISATVPLTLESPERPA